MLAPVPALADTTVRYTTGKVTLTAEIADNGDARIEWPGQYLFVHRGGTPYAVLPVPQLGIAHVPLTDFVDLLIQRGKRQTAAGMEKPGMALNVKAEEAGTETVAGMSGTRWRIDALLETGPRALHMVVVSIDPELAEAGALFRLYAGELMRFFRGVGNVQGNMDVMVLDLVAKGTPIAINRNFRLVSVDHAPIDPQRFALPGRRVTAAELDKALPLVGVTDGKKP